MSLRISLGKRACAAAALLAVLSGAETIVGQQQVHASDDAPPSSIEEGHTQLDESFDWSQQPQEKRGGVLRDTKFQLNLRTYYFDCHQFNGSERQAWAIGGWAGLKTGYFLDHLAVGVTGYTSQRLYGPKDRDGTQLLEPGQISYTVLGELYADLRIIDGLNIVAGRKGYDTPFINRNDSRMTPNTFEAIALQGRTELGKSSTGLSKDGGEPGAGAPTPTPTPNSDTPVIKYGVGYFNKIKERDSDEFVSMSVAAGATVERGVFTAGGQYEKGNFSIGAIDYYSADMINIGYAETNLKIPLGPDWQPTFAAQFVDQHSVGDDLLQGDSFSVWQFGLKAELPVKEALFTAAFTHASGNANLQNPWSGYPGYTAVQVENFDRAGENAFLLRTGYTFPRVEGLSAYALGVFGTTPDLAGEYRQNEYDFNLQWVPPKGVLKGLSLRVRYALVHQYGGDVDNLTEFRAICNYVINF